MPLRGSRRGKKDQQEEPYIYHVERKKNKSVGSNIYFSTKERCYTTTTDEKFLPPPSSHENYQPGYKGSGADTKKVHFVFGDEDAEYVASKMPDHSAFCRYKKANNGSHKVHVHFGDDAVNYTTATSHFFSRGPGDFQPLKIHSKDSSRATNIVFGDDKIETKTQNQEVQAVFSTKEQFYQPSRSGKPKEDLRASHMVLGYTPLEYSTSNKLANHSHGVKTEVVKPKLAARASHIYLGDDNDATYTTTYAKDIGPSGDEENALLQRAKAAKDNNSTNVVLGSDSEQYYQTSRDEFFRQPPMVAYEAGKGQGAGTTHFVTTSGDR